MQNTVQDLDIYFKDLKKQVRIKNFKQFLFFSIFLQMLVLVADYFFTTYMLLPGAKVDNIIYLFMSGMGGFFSIFFWLGISINPDVRMLKNKDTVNLYDALQYLYRGKQKDMTEIEFNNLIDSLYEKERLQDLMNNVNTDKKLYSKLVSEINQLYENHKKVVKSEDILQRELQ